MSEFVYNNIYLLAFIHLVFGLLLLLSSGYVLSQIEKNGWIVFRKKSVKICAIIASIALPIEVWLAVI